MINLRFRIKGKKLLARVTEDNKKDFKIRVNSNKEELKQMPLRDFHILLCAISKLMKEIGR